MENYNNFECYFGVKDKELFDLNGTDIRGDFNSDVSPLDFEDSIVYEMNGFKFMDVGMVKSGSDYSGDIHALVLVKNDGGKKVSIDTGNNDIYVDKVKVGGICYSQTARPGGYALLNIALQGYDLAANNLDMTNITEVTIKFEIKDENYNTVDEPTVTLTYFENKQIIMEVKEMIWTKKKRLDECETEGEKQEWYSQHINQVPVGCRACGGPYPSCIDSCPLFDDD